jgi:hypothetical protein
VEEKEIGDTDVQERTSEGEEPLGGKSHLG